LSAFCKAYPEGNIAIYNDGGKPEIQNVIQSSRENTIFYEYDRENLNVYFHSKENALKWLRRFHRNLSKLKNRWTILLEDDVLIRRRLRNPPNSSIYGGKFRCETNRLEKNVEMFLSFNLSEFIHRKRVVRCKDDSVCNFTTRRGKLYGGSACGGTIIDREFWMKNYNEDVVSKWIDEIFAFMPVLHNDVLISTIVLCLGGNILPNPEYFEVYWDLHAWDIDTYAIIHKFKDYYTE
jgi:hypothetical protein